MQRLTIIAILLSCVIACSVDTDPSIDTPPDPDIGIIDEDTMVVNPIPTTGEEKYLTLDADYLFDQEKLPTFYIELPQNELDILDSDPAAEEYVPGTIIFEGDTIGPVGIRYKGSIGAYVDCLSGNNWANPSGYKTCTKLSMKVKVNWTDKKDKFYGLKKLQFHSMNLDPSQMRDRLGYWMFRQAGVPAPRAIHARIYINGEYNGLFAMIEHIDGRFTKQNWDDGDGNLYKEKWPLSSDGVPFPENEYLAALVTNEDTNPSAELIRSFGVTLAGSSDSTIQSVIEQYMDVDEAISYCVVDRFIRHDDGPFHWYCSGNSCASHNFYWYEEPAQQKLHLIAWDLDNAFENITTKNVVTNIPDQWGETTNNCRPFSSGFLGLQQKSAACDILTGGWASYTVEYDSIKQKLITGSFSESQINAQLDAWTAQIRTATEEANSLHNDAISLSQWQSAVNTLKSQMAIARTR